MAAPNHLAATLTITVLASLMGSGCDKQAPTTENPGADAAEGAPAGDDAGEEPASEEPSEDMSEPGHDMDAMGGEEEKEGE